MCSSLLIVALAIGAPGLKDPPKEPSELVGEWVLQSMTVGGTLAPPFRYGSLSYAFAADGTCTMSRGGGIPSSTQHYEIDAKAKPPAITFKDQPAGPAARAGVFKVEGDTLTLCLDRAENDPPKSFESPKGTQIVLSVFKRMKKE